MSSGNPGNFANRPHEQVEDIARKGGQSSHNSGFAHMDESKQVRPFHSLPMNEKVIYKC